MGESKSQEGVRTCEGDVEVKDTRAERKDQSRVSDWEYKPKRSKHEKIQGPEMRIKVGVDSNTEVVVAYSGFYTFYDRGTVDKYERPFETF